MANKIHHPQKEFLDRLKTQMKKSFDNEHTKFKRIIPHNKNNLSTTTLGLVLEFIVKKKIFIGISVPFTILNGNKKGQQLFIKELVLTVRNNFNLLL